jgi:hypothetical protein
MAARGAFDTFIVAPVRNLKPTRRAGHAESIKKILGRVLNRIKAQEHLSMPCAAAHGEQQMELRALRRIQHRQPVADGRRRVCRVPDAAPSAVGGAGADRGNQVTGIPP